MAGRLVMRLVWITDPHLDFLPPFGPVRFGEAVAAEHPDAGAVVITGDIADGASLGRCLRDFTEGWSRQVYFVLGNHDAYDGAISSAARAAEQVMRSTGGRARWLTRSGVIMLDPGTALVGHDGWYDARLGSPFTTKVELRDFFVIDELRGLDRSALVERLRQLGDRAAAEADPVLREAAACARRVIFATHVPPFREACWHQGATSNDDWLPFFTCKAMGDLLVAVAEAHAETTFTVLCGHTHGDGRARIRPNLEVWTGRARYGAPDVCGIVDESQVIAGAGGQANGSGTE